MLPKDTSREVRDTHKDYIIVPPHQKEAEDTSKEVRGPHQDYISTPPSQEEAKDISSEVRSGCIRII